MGGDEFYKGETANIIVDQVQELGGIMTKEDLASYEVKWRDPITFMYKGHKIISMPPPSSGGICLAQILKSIEPFNIEQYPHNSTQYIQAHCRSRTKSLCRSILFFRRPRFCQYTHRQSDI